MAVIEDLRSLGAELERSYPVYVRGRLKFRVKADGLRGVLP